MTVSEPGFLSSGAAVLRSPLTHIDADETLRAGSYSRTLTFSLSTTEP